MDWLSCCRKAIQRTETSEAVNACDVRARLAMIEMRTQGKAPRAISIP